MMPDNITLVNRIEHTFNIRIPESRAQKILTVGDMHEVVKEQVNEDTARYCVSYLVFSRLRQMIHEAFGVPIDQITPETILDELLPEAGRRANWNKLLLLPDLEFPKLVLPRKWEVLLIWTGVITILGGLYASATLYWFYHLSPFVLLLPAAGVALTILLSYMLEPLRTAFPEQTMLNFTYHMQLLNGKRFLQQPLTKQDMDIVSMSMEVRMKFPPDTWPN